MATREKIDEKTIEILSEAPNGMRFTDLVAKLETDLPGGNQNSIKGAVNSIASRKPSEVVRPSRGLYLATKFAIAFESEDETESSDADTNSSIKEEDFYEPFAEWMVGELEECTRAISVGGNSFGKKWGTPDVIGVRASKKSDIIQFPTEIISAEIKLDVYNLITAFGQSCAYRLFSHKSYLVVPSDSSQADLARLDALSRIFSLGLILFDRTNPDNPAFDIRVRAASHEPDMFYVNQNMKVVEDELFN